MIPRKALPQRRSRLRQWFRALGLRRPLRQPHVTLTLDDGPEPGTTEPVLDLLADLSVHAVFFLLGRKVVQHPGLVRRIRSAGHTLGHHTQNHRPLGWWDWRAARDDLEQGKANLEAVLGERVNLFRPAYGRLPLPLRWWIRRHGLQVWDWDVDSKDWQCRRTEDVAAWAAEILPRIQPGDVLLFHDAHPLTPALLRAVLPELRDRGWLPPLVSPDRTKSFA